MKKVVFISFRNTAQLNSGDKIGSYSYLKQSAKENNLLFINILDEGPYSQEETEKLNLLKIKYHLTEGKEKTGLITLFKSLFTFEPLLFVRKLNKEKIKKEIELKCREFNPDVIIWDHLRTVAYFSENLSSFNNILIEHNNEIDLLQQRKSQYGFPLSLMVSLQVWFLQRAVKKIYIVFNKVIYVSSFDVGRLAIKPKKSYLVKFLNITFDHKPYVINKKSSKNIVFVGSLDWFPNVAGIEWFVKNVFPILPDDTTLSIVGKNPGKKITWLETDRIKVYANVKSTEEFIQNADVFVCPILSGGGINIKILEALSYGIPIAATSHSLRGYPEDICISGFDSPELMAKEIQRIFSDENYKLDLYNKELAFYNQYLEYSANEFRGALND